MATTVDLGNMDAVVRRLVAEGRYASVDEALKQGLLLVQERETARDNLLTRISEGIADADAGRMIPAEQVRSELLAELYARHPDVFGENEAA